MRQLMEFLLAKDLLTDPGLLLPEAGSILNIPYNVAYFACKLVDKLWQVGWSFLSVISLITSHRFINRVPFDLYSMNLVRRFNEVK